MKPERLRVIASRVYRIGKQTLYESGDGQYYLGIKNRTYKSIVQIPQETFERYRRLWRARKRGE